jgi:hypothetical protein
MANLTACVDVVIWAIDLKNGMELKPWAPCIGRLATTPEQAAALLREAASCKPGPNCSPRPAGECGSPRRTCPRW